MLWIIGVLAGIRDLFAIINFISDYNWYRTHIGSYYYAVAFPAKGLRTCIIFFIIAAVSIAAAILLEKNQRYTEKEVETKELVSVKTDSGIKGSGSGSLWYFAFSLESQNTYSLYYKLSDGGYHRETIDARYTQIYEDSQCTPRVEKHKYLRKYRHPLLTKILILKGNDPENYSYHHEMYVPENTILRIFELT